MRSLIVAIKMTVILTFLTGIVYPIAMAGIGHVLFPAQADGSLIYRNGSPIGSSLIAQNFKAARYFHPRPSAAGTNGYDPTSSSGSNLGPTNKSFIDSVKQRTKAVMEEDSVPASQVPIDMVTASGSGLDPQISPAAAEIQVERIAKARGLTCNQVRVLINANTQPRWAGFLGEPGVNVLQLNLGLDATTSNQPSRDEVDHSNARILWTLRMGIGSASTEDDWAAAIIDSLDNPAFLLDQADTIIHLNRSAAEILAIDRDRIIGHQFTDDIENHRASCSLIRTALESAFAFPPGEQQAELSLTVQGRDRCYLLKASQLRGGSGDRSLGTLVILHDISLRSEKGPTPDNAIAAVAQQFNTPLTSLLLAARVWNAANNSRSN